MHCVIVIKLSTPSTNYHVFTNTYFALLYKIANIWMLYSGFVVVFYRAKQNAADPLCSKNLNRIGGVMVSVLASSAVDCGFGPQSGQTKYYRIGICCFFAKAHSFKEKKQRLVDSKSG